MKTILFAFILLGAPLYVSATEPHPAMVRHMHLVFREATPADSLEFLRRKGTEFLREALPPASGGSVMIFEYRFDPTNNRKRGKRVNYDRKDVSYSEALREVLQQLGLDYRIESVDRIAILDAR